MENGHRLSQVRFALEVEKRKAQLSPEARGYLSLQEIMRDSKRTTEEKEEAGWKAIETWKQWAKPDMRHHREEIIGFGQFQMEHILAQEGQERVIFQRERRGI